MKHIIKVLSVSLIISLCLSFVSFGAYKGLGVIREIGDGQGYVYVYWTGEYDENGCSIQLTNTWKECNNCWLYFGEDGKSKCNTWFQDTDDKWYYFDNRSVMLHDTTTPDGYSVGSDGAWIE